MLAIRGVTLSAVSGLAFCILHGDASAVGQVHLVQDAKRKT